MVDVTMEPYVKLIIVIIVIVVVLSSIGAFWTTDSDEVNVNVSEGFYPYNNPSYYNPYYGRRYCGNCGYGNRASCQNCTNCGLCTTSSGRTRCLPGSSVGPTFANDCAIWENQGNRIYNPNVPRYNRPVPRPVPRPGYPRPGYPRPGYPRRNWWQWW